MRKLFIKYCRPYRWLICKLLHKPHSGECGKLTIPFGIYGNFDVHYLIYDENGYVHNGFRTLREALKNKGNMGLTVLYDKY